ncbi:glutamate synthase central domain-containing protein [Okeania sp. SIO1I7]|uniref:glutamate synthase central domain-containing protein n=1 Tax=Okeania sp. SIO1I7 TaxID=2607772 RepID=UPI003454B263
MSLEVFLGGHRNLLEEDAAHAKQLQLLSPIVNEPELEHLIENMILDNKNK